MTQTSKTHKLQKTLEYATRTGDHELAARTRRILERTSGQTYAQHYNERWEAQKAMKPEELV